MAKSKCYLGVINSGGKINNPEESWCAEILINVQYWFASKQSTTNTSYTGRLPISAGYPNPPGRHFYCCERN